MPLSLTFLGDARICSFYMSVLFLYLPFCAELLVFCVLLMVTRILLFMIIFACALALACTFRHPRRMCFVSEHQSWLYLS